jgi:integrase
MPVKDGNKRLRHVPVRGASNVYYSETAKGRVYEVRHPSPSRAYEVVGTRLDAAKQRAREIHGESAPRVVKVGITLGEVYAAWVEAREMRARSAETFDVIYRCHIEPTLGRRKVRDLDSQAMLVWLAALKRKDGKDGELAPATKRLILSTLQLVLQHAVETGALGSVPKLPKRRVPQAGPGRKRILTQDEEQVLLAYCAPSPWLRPVITVALHQALRLGEVAGLQWEDIDWVGGKLRVRQALGRDGNLGPTKSGREDTIQLNPAARAALLDLRQESDGTGFVFRNKLGARRQLRDITRAFEKARDRAGLEDVVFHSLRHTGISRLANHPAISPVRVRDFARHSNLATTMGYMHSTEDDSMADNFAEALAG